MKTRYLIILFIGFVFFSSCKKDNPLLPESNQLYAVRGSSPGIFDREGRYMILRGVNYNVLGDYWQANSSVATTKQYSPEDISMMASYGFNCVRLLFSWSRLEPVRGNYDETYIQQIKTVIEEAAKYNMYVMIDMHQDAWGKFIATPVDSVCLNPNKGWDGAPEWATITDGMSTCTEGGMRESAPAVYHAFQNFWDNTNGIQDACIAAWQHLVSATAPYENVLGYDLINEPGLGYKTPLATEQTKLSNYYANLIIAIRSAEGSKQNEHIVFIENPVTYNGLGFIGYPDQNFSTDNNIVAAPHHYFESLNSAVSIETGYGMLMSASAYYSAKLFVGEWGFFGDPASDVSKVKRFGVIEDANFGSSTWWQWSQAPGDPHGISWDGTSYGNTSLHLIELDQSGNFTGNKNEIYLKVLGRTRPLAIHGTPSLLTSDSDNGLMHLEAIASSQGVTKLWIPNFFGEPVISGTNAELKNLETVEGGYYASVSVNGSYSIDVTF